MFIKLLPYFAFSGETFQTGIWEQSIASVLYSRHMKMLFLLAFCWFSQTVKPRPFSACEGFNQVGGAKSLGVIQKDSDLMLDITTAFLCFTNFILWGM